MLAVYENACEVWVPEWSGQTAILRGHPIAAPVDLPGLEEAGGRLGEALEAVLDFARRVGGPRWAAWFLDALALREAGGSDPADEYSLLPQVGYSVEARRLLACASKVWVFGGMGSWNDLVFSERTTREEYERLTALLFDAVLASVAAAANAGDAARP